MGAQDDDALMDSSPYKPTIVPIQDTKAERRTKSSSGKARQYATAIILNMAALAGGTVMGWSSPAGAILTNQTSLPLPLDADGDGIGEPVSGEHISWLASINFLVGSLGTLLFGALADRLGRRIAGLVVAVPYSLSWVLIATTDSLLPLYAARILGGIATGGTFVVVSLYIAEMAEDEHRGPLGTLLAVGINGGIFFAYVVSAVTSPNSYRVMPLVLLILPAVYFLGLLKLPETPVYLVKRGRMTAARRALTWYRGGSAVDAELEALQAAAKLDDANPNSATLADLFTHRGTRRALLQSLTLLANQQFCGVIAVLSYVEVIFKEAGSSLGATESAIIVAGLQAVATYLSSFLMDRAGRRPLLLYSNLIMALCLVTLGGCFYAKTNLGYDISTVGWLPLLAMSLYVIAFAMGVGPVPLVLLSETYATRVRSLATAVGMGVQTMCAFTATKFFLNLQSLMGLHGCLWLFAACCFACAIFVLFVVVETKGKTLDHILAEFHDGAVAVPTEDEDFDDIQKDEEDDNRNQLTVAA